MNTMLLRRTLRSQFINAVRESFIMKYDRTQLEDWAFEGTIDNNVMGANYSSDGTQVDVFIRDSHGCTLTYRYPDKKLLEIYLDKTLDYDYVNEFRLMMDEIYQEDADAVGLTVFEYIPLLDAVQELMYKLQADVRFSMSTMRKPRKFEFTKEALTPIIGKLLNNDLDKLRTLVVASGNELILPGRKVEITVTVSGKNGSLTFDDGDVTCHLIKSTDGIYTVLHDFTIDRGDSEWIPIESVHYLKLLIDLSNNLGTYIIQSMRCD